MLATKEPQTITSPAPVGREECDACTARAAVHVTLPSGGRLTFCGHHYGRHEKALYHQGARVTHDDRPA